MPARGSRLLGDGDELTRFQPRGLQGGAEQPGVRWRPTRLEAEDKATLTTALVEEVRGSGWRYTVWRATRVIATGERLDKKMAITFAQDAMAGRGPAS